MRAPLATRYEPAGVTEQAAKCEDLKIPISKTRLKITFLKSDKDLPGANELILLQWRSLYETSPIPCPIPVPLDIVRFFLDLPDIPVCFKMLKTEWLPNGIPIPLPIFQCLYKYFRTMTKCESWTWVEIIHECAKAK